ncbi:GDP-L-fucose synthase family protein [Salsipaludibacter albus]|uniref:GDP-L-fucose synthase family protein n=1 Tax=Salsipaludibacter albus TaxID=2849650 RepID=UPI0023682594|nr:GDP-L-fucose synthase [Salsipaludibacter albus]
MTDVDFDLAGRRVWVAGHTGLVGRALLRRLADEPVELVTARSAEVDLTRQDETEEFVARTRPDVCIMAAARVGGVHANRSAQATFLYDNLVMAANTVEACRRNDVAKTVLLGSTCIYPREAPQPMPESSLLTGPLEETNEGYAIAKIAALELAKMYRRQHGMDAIALMPTNLYGPGDDFDPQTSHVLPALLRKVHEAHESGAETVELWGTGTPRREFLHVDDLADAVVFALRHVSREQHVNVGVGRDIAIADLARLIADVVGWDGDFTFDPDMPDGTPRKLVDVSVLSGLGWTASIGLEEGIRSTLAWYRDHGG